MKKILIITYYWPPSGGPGVQRWLKFSKYLPEFGYDPIIITVDPEKAEYPIKDYTLEQDVRADQIVYRTDCSGLYEYYKKLTKAPSAPYSGFVNEGTPSLKQKIARFIRGNFFLPDARRGWNKHAYHQAIQIIQEEKIDAVITTGPPMSTHLVGQKLKKRFHLHWIADFRDPWTDIYYYNKMYPTPIAKAIDRKYERNVLLNADQVITVSDYIKKQLAAKSPAIQASKIKVIANGFDAEDFDLIIPKEDVFTITYTGTLAADYTIDSFIHTVKRLSTSEKLKLRFVGKVDQGIAQKLSKQLGDSVEIHAFVAHADAIKYMKSSSVLLLIIPNIEGNKGNLTGKLFEYIGSRTPILCLGPTDGDAATIIQVCKAGKTFEYDDEEGMLHFLTSLLNNFDPQSPIKENNVVNRYSRKSLTQSLIQILAHHED
ncbi:MAG TPA: hypothetical protein DFK15_11650 [Butyricimonas sp.]|uniref:glycosyltransferase family 4 protein n=1 Tax=Butyricimonas TaxID=574697 RepID=UPI000EE8C283|nr:MULTISPECIES: glycosyltransferase family 4 protein [Butyricimonas]HAM83932.1 hypothetical protein [Butyricimonas sp.]HCH89932.1 hypothetical protein [Butyricimonas sp.]